MEESSIDALPHRCSTTVSFYDLKELSRIELPCFINDPDRAIAAIGGEETVAETIRQNATALHFQLSSLPTNGSNLSASIVKKNGILLKIRRPKGYPEKATCEVVGSVPSSYVFNSLADYKFVSPNSGDSTILNTPPHSFCRDGVNKITDRILLQDPPKKAAHVVKVTGSSTGVAGAAGAAAKGDNKEDEEQPHNTEGKTRNPDKGLACFITTEDPVPQQHPRGEYPYSNERGILLVKLLKKLFSILPILSREQIETFVDLEGRVHLFKSCLPYVAYCFVKGPFRKLWVRFGYDPKQHPESAIYQSIHFRVSPQVVKDVTERVVRKVGSTIGRNKMVDLDSLRISEMPLNSVTYLLINRPQDDPAIFVYNHVLKMQFIVQIYQLMDPNILAYLRGTQLLPSFDNTTGWYPAETLNTLRVLALKVLPERIDSFLKLPDSAIWESYHSKTAQPTASAYGDIAWEGNGGSGEGSGGSSGGGSEIIKGSARLTGEFELHADAEAFGFLPGSTGLFVVFNRTMNTIRAYLDGNSAMSGTGSSSNSTNSSNNSSRGSRAQESGELTMEGAAVLDPLFTVDGIYCGRALAWLRPYTRICTGHLLQNFTSTESWDNHINMRQISQGRLATKPVARRNKVSKPSATSTESQNAPPLIIVSAAEAAQRVMAHAAAASAGVTAGESNRAASGVHNARAFELLDEESETDEGDSSDSGEGYYA